MKIYIFLSIIWCLLGCTKKLDLKPSSNLVLPTTIQDFENLLDNSQIMNKTTGLIHASADEYDIPTLQVYESLSEPLTKATYIWQAEIFQGKTKVQDWTVPYSQIFICNSILDILAKQNTAGDAERQRIKGWALFCRAYAFYSLASTFAKAYDNGTANIDAGIPLKLTSSVTEIVPRSSVQQTYDQIIKDAIESSDLLQLEIPLDKRNRPSKVAAFALLARVYLSMRKYDEAEHYADKSLSIFDELADYNTLPIFPRGSSFSINSDETIYFSYNYESDYREFFVGTHSTIDKDLVSLYSPNDLRFPIYMRLSTNGNFIIKGINTLVSTNPFTGLANDEIYLIKAECLARSGKSSDAMHVLDQLLVKRWNPNATSPPKPYENQTAVTSEIALDRVLLERRKSLIFRNIRWTDLKRLNLEGRNIVLTRKLGDNVYTLEPNSPRYVLPIPDDEIALSGISQNIR